jgi:hypothetical protein
MRKRRRRRLWQWWWQCSGCSIDSGIVAAAVQGVGSGSTAAAVRSVVIDIGSAVVVSQRSGGSAGSTPPPSPEVGTMISSGESVGAGGPYHVFHITYLPPLAHLPLQ